MATRDIRTSNVEAACDVCGRTLLRGERAEVYLAGGERRSVCELCKSRALHEGWIKEGTVPAYDASGTSPNRRRSLLSRLRSRGEAASGGARPGGTARPTLSDELDGQAWADAGAGAGARDARSGREGGGRAGTRPRSRVREPRHVRAVPTSIEHKQASAVELFNASEHRRTIAGVARSLGPPMVSVRPSSVRPSLVNLAVSWELCWYRYEVDLSEDQANVRVADQGSELDQLAPDERDCNASSSDDGSLSMTV